MALSTQVQDGVNGLFTSANVFKRPPNTMFDCMNTIYTSSNSTEARKGQPIYFAPTTSETEYNAVWLGMYPHPTDADAFFIPTGNVIIRLDGVTWDGNAVVKFATPGTSTAGTQVNYRPITTARDGWLVPRQINAQKNTYFMMSNGWFRSEPNAPDNLYRVMMKTISDYVVEPYNTTVSAVSTEDWLAAGNVVSIIMLVREKISQEGFLRHPATSEILFSAGVGYPNKPKITFKVQAPNLDAKANAQVEVYRTLQYAQGDERPAEFYLAEVYDLANVTFTDSESADITVILDGSDSLISFNERLYFGARPAEEFSCPPMARCVDSFRGYTIYGSLTTLPTADLTITGVANDTMKLTVKYGDSITGVAFRNFGNGSGASNVPNVDGYLTPWTTISLGSESYRGVPNVDYTLVLRPSNPGGDSTNTVCGVLPDVSTTSKIQWSSGNSETTRNIKVILNGTTINTGAFPTGQPGYCAVVERGNVTASKAGVIREIFYYDDVEYISTAGKLEFVGTTSRTGWNGTGGATADQGVYQKYTGAAPVAYAAGGDILDLHFIPGTSDTAIDVFEIGGSGVASGGTLGWSLKPVYLKYPTILGRQQPVGTISGFVSTVAAGVYTVKARIDFIGVDFRNSVTQYNRAVQRWVLDYSTARGPFSPLASYFIGDGQLAKIRFQHILPWYHTTTEALETQLLVYQTTTSTALPTEPDISVEATPTDLLLGKGVDIPNGIVLSTLNKPEQVRLGVLNPTIPNQEQGSILRPLRVGKDDSRIVQLAVNYDSVYVFKDTDGVWKLNLQEGGDDPILNSLVQVDDTVQIACPESVQVIEDAVYFVAFEGAYRIAGNSLANLSGAIAIELRDAITKSKKAGTLNQCRGFRNDSRGYYGFTLVLAGGTSITYVYDIGDGQWAKWDFTGPVNYLYLSDGRLLRNYRLPSTNWNVIKGDRYTTGQNDDADQVDWEVVLTGATFTTSTNVLRISRAAGATLFSGIGDLVTQVTSGQWFYKRNTTLYPVTVTKINASVLDVTFTGETAVPAGYVATDSLVMGVQTSMTFNRNFIGGPSAMKQFVKYHLFIDGQCNLPTLSFDIDRDKADSQMFVGKKVVTFEQEYWNLVTLIPRQSGRGNHLMTKVTHKYPYQAFRCNGFTVVYRSMDTERIERD